MQVFHYRSEYCLLFRNASFPLLSPLFSYVNVDYIVHPEGYEAAFYEMLGGHAEATVERRSRTVGKTV